MAISDKVIITCAVTGAIHTPTMSPYLPITPDQIAEEAIAAAEAGAAILHLHARDPETGKPDQTPEAFARFLPRIKQSTNAAINITTGGSPYMTRRRAREAGGDLQAGSRLAQHGLDQFRALSPARQIQELQIRLGEAASGGDARSRLPQHASRTSNSSWRPATSNEHALRVRMLRHRASLQSRAFRSIASSSSRRSSCSRCSACSAASARIPKTSRT